MLFAQDGNQDPLIQMAFSDEQDVRVVARLRWMLCPSDDCEQLIVRAEFTLPGADVPGQYFAIPRISALRAADPAVPDPHNSEYKEAALIRDLSAMGSAAITRRILQTVLRDKGGYNKQNLSDQIDDFCADLKNPSQLKDNLHHLREIGNFATHAQKSTNSGAVIPVESGEAEWALEVLDGILTSISLRLPKTPRAAQSSARRLRMLAASPLHDDLHNA